MSHHDSRHSSLGASSHHTRQRDGPITIHALLSLPSNDQPEWYTPGPSSPPQKPLENLLTPEGLPALPSAAAAAAPGTGNRGRKLASPSTRFLRRGKMCAWSPASREFDLSLSARQRLKSKLQQFLPFPPFSSTRSRSPSPPTLPHLRDSDATAAAADVGAPTTTADLSYLLRPPASLAELVQSPAVRHSFKSGHLNELSKTAAEMVEAEKDVSRAIGRVMGELYGGMGGRAVLEEAKAEEEREREKEKEQGAAAAAAAAEPKEGEGEAIQPDGVDASPPKPEQNGLPSPSSSSLLKAPSPTPPPRPLTYLESLFLTPSGLSLPLPSAPTPSYAAPNSAAQPRATNTIHLSLPAQRQQMQRHLEALHEALADSREFVERMNEVRARLAECARVRTAVWRGVREKVVVDGGGELDD